MDPRKIITDEEIERVHANANFGTMSKRDVVNTGDEFSSRHAQPQTSVQQCRVCSAAGSRHRR